MQGNEIAALDPSQESDAVSLDLSKVAWYSSSSDASAPMDFDSKVTEALAHLDHNPAPRTIVKFSISCIFIQIPISRQQKKKNLQSHNLAGFRMYIMGYQVNHGAAAGERHWQKF